MVDLHLALDTGSIWSKVFWLIKCGWSSGQSISSGMSGTVMIILTSGLQRRLRSREFDIRRGMGYQTPRRPRRLWHRRMDGSTGCTDDRMVASISWMTARLSKLRTQPFDRKKKEYTATPCFHSSPCAIENHCVIS